VEKEICSLCGGPARLVEGLNTLRMGSRPVTFMDRFYRCERCEEEYFLGDMMDESLRRATAVIRAEDGLLAPDDIIALRKKYGLSQADLERLIGAGQKTVVRWERGTVCQNKTADTLLRVLLEHPDVVTQLKKQNGLQKPSRRAKATRARKAKVAAADRA
jgi:HTH-type transcriptional regulator/antitoxin MqsA